MTERLMICRRTSSICIGLVAMSWLLLLLLLLGGQFTQALPSNKTAFTLSKRLNREGPYLGLVVPNPYEIAPLLSDTVFKSHPFIPYLDLAGIKKNADSSLSISSPLSFFSEMGLSAIFVFGVSPFFWYDSWKWVFLERIVRWVLLPVTKSLKYRSPEAPVLSLAFLTVSTVPVCIKDLEEFKCEGLWFVNADFCSQVAWAISH